MKLLLIISFFLSLLAGCASQDAMSQRRAVGPLQKINKDSILNYEDSTLSLHQFNIDSHFYVRIEIESVDKPLIIKTISLDNIKRIYKLTRIEGYTIFYAHVDKNGSIASHQIVKTAGLGLDKLAAEALNGIKLSPVYSAGKKYESKVYIRIGIKGKKQL